MKTVARTAALLLAALLLATAAIAEPKKSQYPYLLTGEVVGVTDGDTITVLVEKTQYKVRLNEIDAPEKKQPYGQAAKKALSDMIFGLTVDVIVNGKDRYGRLLAEIMLTGIWINQEMIRAGMAWHYRQYSRDPDLAAAEDEARAAGRGLWADPVPGATREWRRR